MRNDVAAVFGLRGSSAVHAVHMTSTKSRNIVWLVEPNGRKSCSVSRVDSYNLGRRGSSECNGNLDYHRCTQGGDWVCTVRDVLSARVTTGFYEGIGQPNWRQCMENSPQLKC
jgi:hypothetical protein